MTNKLTTICLERITLILLVVFCTLTGKLKSENIYVDYTATGNNNGTDWLNAFFHLQDALLKSKRGDVILVAQGTYRPDMVNSTTTGDRNSSFIIKSGTVLMGGFPHGGSNPEQRNHILYPTVLSGDLKANDPVYVNQDTATTNDPNRLDNCFHVLTTDNTDPNTVIDGFDITSGNCSGSFPDTNSIGGGILNKNGAPVIKNCTFKYNTAQFGAAVYNMSEYENRYSAKLSFCVFKNNSSTVDGGAVNNLICKPEILSCIFVNNKTLENGNGGAIYNYNSQPFINACGFFGNKASAWGGAIDNNSSNAEILNCIFSENNAQYGGAIDNVNCDMNRIINCTFYSNIAQTGGAVRNEETNVEISNCIFKENQASAQGNSIALQLSSHADITYCNIQNLQQGFFRDSDSTYNFDEISNIDADPQFILPAGPDRIPGTSDDNLHLKSTSPCIDAGNNSAFSDPYPDIDLQDRFIDDPLTEDTGNGTGPIADIGADEYTTVSDLNSDGLTDIRDLIKLADQWLITNCIHNSECNFADIDMNMKVNLIDLGLFAENWIKFENQADTKQ